MSRGSKFKALLYRVALDEVPELSGLASEVYACARDLAKPLDVFAEQRAKHMLLRSMRHLMRAAQSHNGTNGKRKATMNPKTEIEALRAVDNAARYLLLELDRYAPPTVEIAEWMSRMRGALAEVPPPPALEPNSISEEPK